MSNKGTFQPDSDVHITFEDQQKINQFAQLNAKLEDIKDELRIKETEFQNIEEACEEIEFLDDDAMIPYLVGEIFIYQNCERTKSCLEIDKKDLSNDMKRLNDQSQSIKDKMSDLKSHLYGKFGNHINLEADD